MRLGRIVGTGMILLLTTYSIITLFGTQLPIMTTIIFFIYSSITGIIIVTRNKKSFSKSPFFMLFEVFAICASVSFLIGNTQLYVLNNYLNEADINSEVTDLSSLNDYYSEYLTYINSEVLNYEASNEQLKTSIAKSKLELALLSKPTKPTTVKTNYENNKFEEEEYDDD